MEDYSIVRGRERSGNYKPNHLEGLTFKWIVATHCYRTLCGYLIQIASSAKWEKAFVAVVVTALSYCFTHMKEEECLQHSNTQGSATALPDQL